MTDEEVIQKSAQPHLIASAKLANETLSRLNSILADLRLEVADLNLQSDIHLNELLKTGNGVELQKSNWKVSAIYKKWKDKAGKLSDLRAIRRSLDRHCEMLMNQEKYKPRNNYDRVL